MISLKDISNSDSATVGKIISERLVALGMKQCELSDLTGITKPALNDVIKERRSLTAEMAVLIESALGISADMLLAVQNKVELDKAYSNAKILSQLQCMEEWSEMEGAVSAVVLKKIGLLKNNVKHKVEMAKKLFHVETIDEFHQLTDREQTEPYFKKSDKLNVDSAALFTWKYYCYDCASKVIMSKTFDSDGIDSLNEELKAILANNNDTYNRVQRAFEDYGIRFLYIKKIGQVPVDGLPFWRDNNPTVVITRRLPNIDNFAFSIMHELGHVKLHLKKNDVGSLVNIDGVDIDTKEAQANEYARNSFVPQSEWDRFMHQISTLNPYSVSAPIRREAERLGVHPQILYGRYMHDTGLYRLRRVFETEVR